MPQKVNVGFAPDLIFVSKAGTYPSGATSGTPIRGMLIFGGNPEGVYHARKCSTHVGELLPLLTNIRPGWRGLSGSNTLAYCVLFVGDGGKKFYNVDV